MCGTMDLAGNNLNGSQGLFACHEPCFGGGDSTRGAGERLMGGGSLLPDLGLLVRRKMQANYCTLLM